MKMELPLGLPLGLAVVGGRARAGAGADAGARAVAGTVVGAGAVAGTVVGAGLGPRLGAVSVAGFLCSFCRSPPFSLGLFVFVSCLAFWTGALLLGP